MKIRSINNKKHWNKKYLAILLVLMVFATFQIQAQTVKEILKKIENKFESKKQYKIKADYTLYRGLIGTQKLIEYKGELIFNKPVKYNKINKTETIVSKNSYIKVNHEQKAMVYSNSKNFTKQSQELDITSLLKTFNTGKLTQDAQNWICELLPKKYSPLPYTRISLIIDKKTLLLKKQVMLLKNKFNYSKTKEKEMDYMRLEIKFHPVSALTKEDFKTINIDRFVKKQSKKVTLTDKYKNYQLILNN